MIFSGTFPKCNNIGNCNWGVHTPWTLMENQWLSFLSIWGGGTFYGHTYPSMQPVTPSHIHMVGCSIWEVHCLLKTQVALHTLGTTFHTVVL